MENETEIVTKPPESADTYHRFHQLVRVAYYTRALSWVILVISILSPVAKVLENASMYSSSAFVTWAEIVYLVKMMNVSVASLFLNSIAIGLYRFAVLQCLAQVLYLLLDIEYNTHSATTAPEAQDE